MSLSAKIRDALCGYFCGKSEYSFIAVS